MIKKIVIEINGQEIDLTLGEMKLLYSELSDLLGAEKEKVYYPYTPTIPNWFWNPGYTYTDTTGTSKEVPGHSGAVYL